MKAEQLALDLSARPALGREDFVVSGANVQAVAQVESDARWPAGRLALTGPEATGKTHLVQVWAARTEALALPSTDLPRYDVPTLAQARRVAVEDVPAIAGLPKAEAALFHLYNLLHSEGGRLLVTGRTAPGDWGIRLGDLRSRLNGMPHVALTAPDDDLLAALLEKQFSDRHMAVDDKVIPYLLVHMTRSAASARRLAAELNQLSLARRQRATVPLARAALDRLGGVL